MFHSKKSDQSTPAPQAVTTGTAWDDIFTWAEARHGLILTKYLGHDPQVTIPGKVAGKAVYQIGDAAFSGHTELVQVTIEEGPRCISARAFAGCANLADIPIPCTVTEIHETAFADCPSLRETPQAWEVLKSPVLLSFIKLLWREHKEKKQAAKS